MRNRKLNRGLIPLVILVWGLIAFRIWYEEGPSDASSTLRVDQKLLADMAEREIDTFSLSLPYRDPFLGSLMEESKRSPKEQRIKSTSKMESTSDLPYILYQGSIEAKERLGLLLWNGKNHRVQAKDVLYHAKIEDITPQYIDLLIEGKTYRIDKGKSIGAG